MLKLRQIFARFRAWFSRPKAAQAVPVIKPAPVPLRVVERHKPERVTVAGTLYYRDARGTYWRVMREERDDKGRLLYVVGRRVPRIVRAA